MPYSLTMTLQSVDPSRPAPHQYGRALHGLFYTWLRRGGPAMATAIHEQDGARPFTVSPVRRPTDGAGTYAFRLTLLDDALLTLLTAGLDWKREALVEQHPCVIVATDGQPYRITQTLCGYENEGLRIKRNPCSYEELLRDARAETTLVLRFLSPTAFHSRKMQYPLPDPVLLFSSFLTRWNAFAPAACRINESLLDVVTQHVAISRHQLRTEAADFGRYPQIGFVGEVHYRVLRPRKLGAGVLRSLNALADYAAFCGTGHHTAQGLGQTVRVHRPAARSP